MENAGAWLMIGGAAILSGLLVIQMHAAAGVDDAMTIYWAACAAMPILFAYSVYLRFLKVRPAPVVVESG